MVWWPQAHKLNHCAAIQRRGEENQLDGPTWTRAKLNVLQYASSLDTICGNKSLKISSFLLLMAEKEVDIRCSRKVS